MPKNVKQRKAEKRSIKSKARAEQNRKRAAAAKKPADVFASIPSYVTGFLEDSHSLATNVMHLTTLVDQAYTTAEKLYQNSGSTEDEKKLNVFKEYKETLEKVKPQVAELYRRIGSIEDAETSSDKMGAIFETFSVFTEVGGVFQDLMERFHSDGEALGIKPPVDAPTPEVEQEKTPADEPTEFETVDESSDGAVAEAESVEPKLEETAVEEAPTDTAAPKESEHAKVAVNPVSTD